MALRGLAEAPSGLGVEDLAGTTERAYCQALGIPVPEGRGEVWAAAARWGLSAWENSAGADDAVPVAALVAEMYGVMRRAMPELPELESLLVAERAAVEAACRHLIGAIDCDREDVRRMGEREQFWRGWARRRTETLGAR